VALIAGVHNVGRHEVTMRLRFILAVIVATTVTTTATSGARITFDDLASLESIGAPVLSPTGTELAFVDNGQIALMPADGGWPIRLTTTPGGKSGLAWSPDGRSIAFASQGSIWTVPSRGGEPRRLTHAAPGGGDPRQATDRTPRWSPKGSWLLFETGRRSNNDLMVVSEDGVRTSFLTMTDADEASAAWSPDGTRIAYVERTREHFSGALKVIDFDPLAGNSKGMPRVLYVAATDRGGGWSIRTPVWSPDGRHLAVVLQTTGWDKIHLVPSDGSSRGHGEPSRAITTGEGEDESPAFSPDGRSMAFVSNRGRPEERCIWIAPVDGHTKTVRLTDLGPGAEAAPQWSPDGSRMYFTRNTPLEPSNLYVAQVAAGDKDSSRGAGRSARALTRTLPKNFEAAGFAMPEVIRYKSRDGLDIAAILYRPRRAAAPSGKLPPAVLWIHGGPEGQDGLTWDPWAHFLTQEGYVVLQPNYRGSSGYGERFRNLNVEDSGGGEVDDVVAGAQYLVDHGLADRARLAIGGGSHGGTMVAYAVTKHPDLFKAAIELYGVVDRATFNERTNRNSAIRWMMKMGGSPDEKPDVYRKANSLADVAKIKTPLLVMHGEDDPQVPPYESAQFVNALKRAGKTHLYFTYPKEGHGFAQREHRLDAWKKQLAFLNKYLQPEYGKSITSTDEVILRR
jgi:dipeptidyl aminopeptidase/acylaminoacyl peptidase